jgi:site-specific DNA recombinase
MEKRAVIYIRVSDPSQIENNSLKTQEDSCRQFAKLKGYQVVEPVFREEGKSAKHIQTRPALRQLLAFCCKKSSKVDAVIVYKFDRFSRNTEEGLATISLLAKYKVMVISSTEDLEPSPMGTAMRSIMMTLGQLDNEMKGQRVKDNMMVAFRKGLWTFKCPVGYKRLYKTKEENKGLPPIPDPLLAPLIKSMFEKAATGIYSKAQLARIMNLAGFGDHYQSKADHKLVKQILERTFYYGNMYAKKWNEYSWGKHEPIIDKATWDKAYQRVVLKKKGHVYQDENLYPLKGILRCELCNNLMTTSPSQGKSKKVFYYECGNKKCRKVRINSVLAHQQFLEILTNIQPSQRVIKLFNHMVFTEWDRVINQTRDASEELEKRIFNLKQELISIRKAKDDGIYTLEEAKEQAEKMRQEITVLEIERSDMKLEQYNSEIIREFIEHFFTNLEKLWEILDLAKKQTLQRKIFIRDLICLKSKQIRTPELSPSFQLIEALATENGENVTAKGLEPLASSMSMRRSNQLSYAVEC